METLPWFWIWLVITAVLFVGEMLSLSFFLLPFAVGALAAAVMSAFGVEFVWQCVAFIIVSVVSLIALRPFARRLTRKGADIKVGVQRLVGMRGKVVDGRSAAGGFRVNVDRELWNAVVDGEVEGGDGSVPEPGSEIEVVAINSNSLLVRIV